MVHLLPTRQLLSRSLRAMAVLLVTAAPGAAVFAQGPTLTAQSPPRNATAVARTANIQWTFSQPITTASIGAIRVHGDRLRGRRPGILTGGSRNTFFFAPAQDFAPGEHIQVSIPATLQSSSGPLGSNKQVYEFTAATGGTGRGNFVAAGTFPVGYQPLEAALGDLDGDGDLDAVVPNYGWPAPTAGTVSIRFNNGSGVFSGSTEVPTQINADRVLLGDLDGDNDLDMLVNGSGSSIVNVRINNGSGVFTALPDVLVDLSNYDMAMGDLDGDGDMDLVTCNARSGTLSVRLNTGNGTFTGTTNTAIGITATVTQMSLGDVDNDGDLDIVTSHRFAQIGSTNIVIRRNNGAGAFTTATYLSIGTIAARAAFYDIDNDGDLDLVVSSDKTYFYHNNGTGTFTPGSSLTTTFENFSMGDIDADGDLDLINSHNSLNVYTNSGTGTFTLARSTPYSSLPNGQLLGQPSLGDLDNDGDLDMVLTDGGASTAYVRLNEPAPLSTAAGSPLQGQLYPNPAHMQVRLEVPAGVQVAQKPAVLRTSLGQTVNRPLQAVAPSAFTLDLQGVTAGLYLLEVPLAGGGQLVQRLVVE